MSFYSKFEKNFKRVFKPSTASSYETHAIQESIDPLTDEIADFGSFSMLILLLVEDPEFKRTVTIYFLLAFI